MPLGIASCNSLVTTRDRRAAAHIIDVVARAPLRIVVLAALVVCAPRAYALDPSRTLSQYVHRIWQVQQGLPQASIHVVLQTRDGYVWLGTETGLVKFDRVRFTSVDDLGGAAIGRVWVTSLRSRT